MLALLLVAMCLLPWSCAQTVSLGECPSLTPVDDFDMEKVTNPLTNDLTG